MRARTWSSTSAKPCRTTPTACASPRFDAEGEELLEARVLLGRRRFRGQRRRGGGRPHRRRRDRLRYPYSSGDELLAICRDEGLRIADVMMENEKAWRSEAEIRDGLLTIWQAMQECVERGIEQSGTCPAG
jgi:L-serine dehydratase